MGQGIQEWAAFKKFEDYLIWSYSSTSFEDTKNVMICTKKQNIRFETSLEFKRVNNTQFIPLAHNTLNLLSKKTFTQIGSVNLASLNGICVILF